MTYAQFHLLFNLPATLILLWLNRVRAVTASELIALGAVTGAVMIFTSPWDNAAVRRGIWDFPVGRYWRRIAWLPVEEYLFFLWQTFNVILSVRALLWVWPALRAPLETPLTWRNGLGVALVALIWCGAAGIRAWRGLPRRWHYGWHLLFWFWPVLAVQWAIAPGLFAAHVFLLGLVMLGWGTYYTAADFVAVRAGVWFFDEQQTTGWKWRGILPWEEIAFFYLTSLLVAQSYLLFLPAALR